MSESIYLKKLSQFVIQIYLSFLKLILQKLLMLFYSKSILLKSFNFSKLYKIGNKINSVFSSNEKTISLSKTNFSAFSTFALGSTI